MQFAAGRLYNENKIIATAVQKELVGHVPQRLSQLAR